MRPFLRLSLSMRNVGCVHQNGTQWSGLCSLQNASVYRECMRDSELDGGHNRLEILSGRACAHKQQRRYLGYVRVIKYIYLFLA